MNTALRGIRVLDLTRLFPFAYGTQMLVDLGAEVLKVEEPGGEVGRSNPGQYAATNRGKSSVVLDLRTPGGRRALIDLLTDVDVVVENFRPGYLERFGIGPERLLELQPSLVVCSVSGYRVDGPNTSAPGHDLSYLVRSGGVLPDISAAPVVPALPIVDMAVGMHLTACISAALVGVERSGLGTHIRIAMSEVALSLNTSAFAFAVDGAPSAVPFPEFVLGDVPCYRLWRSRDGWISLCNLEPKFWTEFLDVIGRHDLSDDALATGRRAEMVIREISEVISTEDTEGWARRFAGREVCFAPVLDPEAALSDEEFASGDLLRRIDGGIEVLFPATFDGLRPPRPTDLVAPGARGVSG